MNSPTVLVLLTLICASASVQGLEDLMGSSSSIRNCLNCLCHARSGCWNRLNCARYSIKKDYWEKAGSMSVGTHSTTNSAYGWCMNDENCIINTIKSYTESFGQIDCNCDGRFDCKDRLAIHLFGRMCHNPRYGKTYADRFNHCASSIGVSSMLSSEGSCKI